MQYQNLIESEEPISVLEDPQYAKNMFLNFEGGDELVKAISSVYEASELASPLDFPTLRMILSGTTGISSPITVPEIIRQNLASQDIPNDASNRDIFRAEIKALAFWLRSDATVETAPGMPKPETISNSLQVMNLLRESNLVHIFYFPQSTHHSKHYPALCVSTHRKILILHVGLQVKRN